MILISDICKIGSLCMDIVDGELQRAQQLHEQLATKRRPAKPSKIATSRIPSPCGSKIASPSGSKIASPCGSASSKINKIGSASSSSSQGSQSAEGEDDEATYAEKTHNKYQAALDKQDQVKCPMLKSNFRLKFFFAALLILLSMINGYHVRSSVKFLMHNNLLYNGDGIIYFIHSNA